MTTHKHACYRRSAQPPAMVLTERDRAIVRAVHRYRLLSRAQVERLLFSPSRRSICVKRLGRLFHHGYLGRIRLPLKPGEVNALPVYHLAREGVALVAEELGVPARGLPSAPEVGPYFLYHALAINDVRIAIEQAAPPEALEKWLDERHLGRKLNRDYVRIVDRDDRSRSVPVIADAYFVLRVRDRGRTACFLELDRSTEDNVNRWRSKVLAYRAYVATGKYRARYDTDSLRILTVTQTAARLTNLKRTTEEVGREMASRFLFTTFEQVTPAQVLSAPIWWRVGERDPQALIDRADTPLS